MLGEAHCAQLHKEGHLTGGALKRRCLLAVQGATRSTAAGQAGHGALRAAQLAANCRCACFAQLHHQSCPYMPSCHPSIPTHLSCAFHCGGLLRSGRPAGCAACPCCGPGEARAGGCSSTCAAATGAASCGSSSDPSAPATATPCMEARGEELQPAPHSTSSSPCCACWVGAALEGQPTAPPGCCDSRRSVGSTCGPNDSVAGSGSSTSTLHVPCDARRGLNQFLLLQLSKCMLCSAVAGHGPLHSAGAHSKASHEQQQTRKPGRARRCRPASRQPHLRGCMKPCSRALYCSVPSTLGAPGSAVPPAVQPSGTPLPQQGLPPPQ